MLHLLCFVINATLKHDKHQCACETQSIRGCLTSYNEHVFESKLSQNSHVVCFVFESKLLHLFCLFNCHVDKWIPSLLLVFF
jgi:hypothetical protein